MHTAVIGAGHVGIVQAVGLAALGHTVTVGEVNVERMARLESGDPTIYEPGLKEQLAKALENQSIRFTPDNQEAVQGAEAVFVSVPTPESPDGSAFLDILWKVVEEIARAMDTGSALVVKSTVPVGTCAQIATRLQELAAPVGVVSNPEFLREGSAVEDFFHPDRIVVGAEDQELGTKVADLYRDLMAPVVYTTPASAELIKVASNAYLSTRITFVNSLANLADQVEPEIDILEVVAGLGMDPRIGNRYLQPGPGLGGACFSKDVAALEAVARRAGYDFELLKAVITTNNRQPVIVVEAVEDLLGGLSGKQVGLWGISFKAGTDDTRRSPAVAIAAGLKERGATVKAYDPVATHPDLDSVSDPITAVDEADGLVLATEWPQFQRVDMAQVAQAMTGRLVLDTRNLLDPEKVKGAGLRYRGWGRFPNHHCR